MTRGFVDLHTHTSASDGTDTPGELMEKAVGAGMNVLAIADHDTVDGVRQAMDRVPAGLTLIPGVELSCRGRAGKCHILGLGIDTENGELTGLLRTLAGLRREKLERRIRALSDRGFTLPEAELNALRAMRAAGKPHLAALLVKYGRVKSREEAFAVLRECGTGEDRIDTKSAIETILVAGGVPVWAHPRGGVDETVSENEFEKLLSELISCGLAGLECFYSMYPMKLCRELTKIAAGKGLLVSAGSDYHGENKPVPLGRVCADGAGPEQAEITVLRRFHSYF